MTFVTSVHCMDGRVQAPLRDYLRRRFGVEYVDAITEPGPCRLLAAPQDAAVLDSILAKVDISVDKHGSKVIAISGHYDCAGNPVDETLQRSQIKESVAYLGDRYPNLSVVGLWVGENWAPEPV